MKRLTLCLITIAILLCGCMQNRSVIEITCQPQFESKLRPELVVTGPDGDRVDARDLVLVLSEGGEQYRFPWGTPPISQSPVALSEHQTYTFRLDATRTEILSIHEGEELIYESLVGTWKSIEFSGPELGALESVVATFGPAGVIRWVGTDVDGTERTQIFQYRVEDDRLILEIEHEESPIPYSYEIEGDVLRMRALRHTAEFVFERVQDE